MTLRGASLKSEMERGDRINIVSSPCAPVLPNTTMSQMRETDGDRERDRETWGCMTRMTVSPWGSFRDAAAGMEKKKNMGEGFDSHARHEPLLDKPPAHPWGPPEAHSRRRKSKLRRR